MKRRLRAPSPALIISLIALFVALGGTTYAAANLPKNSVGTPQLKKNAVTAPKIKSGAVTAAKINTSGLTVPSAVHATSANTATSATNATNATHSTSATTADTANALAGVQIVAGPTVSLASGTQNDQIVTCPTGMVAIGGGQLNNSSDIAVSDNSTEITTENTTDDSAQVFLNNGSAFSVNWNAYAICIHGSESGQP
jgi:hypothetical protein